MHALRVAGGGRGLVGEKMAKPRRDDLLERPRHADVAVQVQVRRLSRGRRLPRPQAVTAVGLALGTDRQRHRRVQVEGQAVERGERPIPQLELELAHRLARGAGRDRPLVERGLGRSILVDAQLADRTPNIGDEDRLELLAGQIARDGAGRRLREPAEIGRVLLDRPLPFPALGGHGGPGSLQLDRLDAASPRSV